MIKNYAIGIDLGTTHSCVCAYDLSLYSNSINSSEIIICHNKLDQYITPSYVKLVDSQNSKEVLIGANAKCEIDNNTFYNMKRFIGKTYNECINDLKLCSFETLNENGKVKIKYDNEYINPENISSIFLKQLKREIEEYLDCSIKNCVITIPAYFNNTQRELTKKAGEDAGFNVVQIINEPSAAALAYKLNYKNELSKTNKIPTNYFKDEINNFDASTMPITSRILIFDFGGGTLDISILDTYDGLVVINTEGDNHLGGEDIDNILIKYCLSEFIGEYSKHEIINKAEIISLCKNQELLQKLRRKCERAKKYLSISDEANIHIKNFYKHNDLLITITINLFERLIEPIICKCKELVIKSLLLNDLNIKDTINDIVLIGGSTRIKCVKSMICELFPNVTVHDKIDPDVSVAWGACVHCSNILLNNSNSFLIDVVSHNLGIELNDGTMEIIIPKNTIKPCIKRKNFTTAYDNQRSIIVKIYEGENNIAKNNLFVMKIQKDNLPAKPSGEIKFIIEFKIDENNIFNAIIREIDN